MINIDPIANSTNPVAQAARAVARAILAAHLVVFWGVLVLPFLALGVYGALWLADMIGQAAGIGINMLGAVGSAAGVVAAGLGSIPIADGFWTVTIGLFLGGWVTRALRPAMCSPRLLIVIALLTFFWYVGSVSHQSPWVQHQFWRYYILGAVAYWGVQWLAGWHHQSLQARPANEG